MRPRRAAALLCAVGLLGAAPALAGPARPAYDVRVLRATGGEPSIAVSPNGRTVLVSGTSPAHSGLYRSTDGGRSYHQLRPTFARSGSADLDLVFLDDTTVVAVDLSVSGDGILVHRSADRGSTWTTTSINNDLYDRPWVDHVADTVYVASRGFDQVPYLYASSDGGRTFGLPVPVIGTSPAGPGPADVAGIVLQHLAVDHDSGDVYVLTSRASGLWVSRLVPGAVPGFESHLVTPALTANGFNWLTVDAAGTVYVLAHEARDGVAGSWLYSSSDRGATWSAGAEVGDSAEDGTVFGAIDGGRAGELSLVYLRGEGQDADIDQSWYAEVARVTRADTARPVVVRARPLAAPVHTEDICSMGLLCTEGRNRNLLDFVSTAITRDGTIFAVVGSDGPATGDDASVGSGGVTAVVFRSR